MDGASSVAGLISLAALVLQSATLLYTFCSKYKHIAPEVEAVVQDITRLQALLQQVDRIITDVWVTRSQHPTALLELEMEIRACQNDLDIWLRGLQEFEQSSTNSSKKFLKMLKAAADEGKFSGMRTKIASHRQQLELRLSCMNMNLGIYSAQVQKQTNTAVMAMKTNQDTLLQEGNRRLETLQASVGNLHAVERDTLQSIDNGFQQVISYGRIESKAMLNHVDTKLQNMQKEILSSIPLNSKRQLARRERRRHSHAFIATARKPAARVSAVQEPLGSASPYIDCFVQIIKPGLLITETQGQLHRKLMALSDPGYEAASIPMKLDLVRQLQGLRLMIWLLERESTLKPFWTRCFAKFPVSELLVEANLYLSMRKAAGTIVLLSGLYRSD